MKTNAMHLQNIRLAVLPMNPKRWWRENKTDCKLKRDKNTIKKPQNTKQTSSCHELCGSSKQKSRPYHTPNLTQNARALTYHDNQPKRWSKQS